MNIAQPSQHGTFTGDHMTHTIDSILTLRNPALHRLTRLAALGVLTAAVVACGGGGGGASTTPTQAALDAAANTKAVADMASTPVNVAVWDQLNAAGADTVRSIASTTNTVTISTFTTITDPTGGGGTIKVFSGVVATGTLDSARVFQLASGTLPASGSVWVNVQNEDFTRNNAGGENALEITVAALASALAAPIP
jgi:RecA/RadA recombinase